MSSPDATEQDEHAGRRGVRVVTDVPRQMLRVAYRDPEHICERLTLQAVHRLAEPSLEWAQAARAAHPNGDLGDVVSGLGTQTARIARLQGMVAGTPFYLALVPGYMNYLWQEARMNLRLAALYGRDPGILQTAAEMLSLRGVYPTTQDAEAGLLAVEDMGMPAKPEHRRPLRLWIECGPADARVRRVHRAAERRASPRMARTGARRRRRRDCSSHCGRSRGSSR